LPDAGTGILNPKIPLGILINEGNFMKSVTYEQMMGVDIKPVSQWWRIGAIPLGVLMTCALLFAMQHLIKADYPDTTEKKKIIIPEVAAVVPKIILVQENELPTKPEIIERPDTLDFIEPIITNVDHGTINIPSVDTTIKVTPGPNIFINDQHVPIVRVSPNYPANAASRNIEGYVDVIFDITPIGTTTNIRIVGYSPSTVFNSSVLNAVRRWKYRAATDESGARMTLDVKERITFVLEK
jgi:periplasmic protein TonB